MLVLCIYYKYFWPWVRINYLFISDDKEGCVDAIQWLRGKHADISSEYEDLTELFMWGNNNSVNDRKGFINDSMARNGACRQFIKNIARFDRLVLFTRPQRTVCILMSLDKYIISTYVLPLLITLGYCLKSKFMMTF